VNFSATLHISLLGTVRGCLSAVSRMDNTAIQTLSRLYHQRNRISSPLPILGPRRLFPELVCQRNWFSDTEIVQLGVHYRHNFYEYPVTSWVNFFLRPKNLAPLPPIKGLFIVTSPYAACASRRRTCFWHNLCETADQKKLVPLYYIATHLAPAQDCVRG